MDGLEYRHAKKQQLDLQGLDFRDQLGHLEAALSNGIDIEDLRDSADLIRFWNLMHFAASLASSYLKKCDRSPASFLWSSILKLCSHDLIKKIPRNSEQEIQIAHNLKVIRMLALSSEAHQFYLKGSRQDALIFIKQAENLCGGEDQVLKSIFKCQQGVIETALGNPFSATKTFDAVLEDLNSCFQRRSDALALKILKKRTLTKRQDMLSEMRILKVGFLDWKDVCEHLSVLCQHNMAVAWCSLGRWEQFRMSARKAFSMSELVHNSQPVRRHILHSYVASLSPALMVPGSPFSAGLGHSMSIDNDSNAENSSCSQSPPNNYVHQDSDSRWKQWLSLGADQASFSPVWISIMILEEMQSDAHTTSLAGSETSLDQLCLEAQAADGSGDVQHARSCYEKAKGRLRALAEGDPKPVLKVIDTFATCLFRLRDFTAAKDAAELGLELCNSRYVESICKLQVSACLFLLKSHLDSFNLAKDVLELNKTELETRFGSDVLMAAGQIMALAHIFSGKSVYALKCAALAKGALENSSFSAKDCQNYATVMRAYEIALCMRTTPFAQAGPASGKRASAGPVLSRLDPRAHIPCTLVRAGLLTRKPESGSSSRRRLHPTESSGGALLFPPLDGGGARDRDHQADSEVPKRYMWTGIRSDTGGSAAKTGAGALRRVEARYDIGGNAGHQAAKGRGRVSRLGRSRLVCLDTTGDLRHMSRSWSAALVSAQSPGHSHPDAVTTPGRVYFVEENDGGKHAAGRGDGGRPADSDGSATTGFDTVSPGRVTRMDLNQIRIGKHAPLGRALQSSQLGRFVSAGQRQALMRGLEACMRASARAEGDAGGLRMSF